jgi:hypothetical protein
MMKSAKQYHAYARECLNLAEEAEQPDVRKSLIELSRVWMQALMRLSQHRAEGAYPGRASARTRDDLGAHQSCSRGCQEARSAPNLVKAAKRGAVAEKANARGFAANVRPIIEKIMRFGPIDSLRRNRLFHAVAPSSRTTGPATWCGCVFFTRRSTASCRVGPRLS